MELETKIKPAFLCGKQLSGSERGSEQVRFKALKAGSFDASQTLLLPPPLHAASVRNRGPNNSAHLLPLPGVSCPSPILPENLEPLPPASAHSHPD